MKQSHVPYVWRGMTFLAEISLFHFVTPIFQIIYDILFIPFASDVYLYQHCVNYKSSTTSAILLTVWFLMFASVISRRLEQLLPQLPDEGGVGGGGEADPAVRGARDEGRGAPQGGCEEV